MDNSMGAKWEKVKAKDGKMRSKKILSVVAPDLVPYCLRHTYCTDLQAKGVKLKTASYLMGHANISITADIYTHITDEALDEAAALIGVTKSVTKDEITQNIA
jgi:site-specific recombinase XerD